jgi:excinuclease ABC subunit C
MKKGVESLIKKLSNDPGVYIFKSSRGTVLYVGKAASLKSRVRSYFSGSKTYTRPIEYAIDQVEKIETKKAETVLEAYLLEQDLIRRLQPKYNVIGKDDKSFVFVCVTDEQFPTFVVKRKTDLESEDTKQYARIYGPYTSKYMISRALKIMRRIFPYHSKKQKTEKGCMDFQLGLCPGPYEGKITRKDYLRNIRGVELMFRGKKKMLIRQLEREMKAHSKRQEFEQATEKRNQLFALSHIQDVALINEERPSVPDFAKSSRKKYRIEGYDISNIGGKFNVGSMVVFEGRWGNIEPVNSQYRRFKLKTIQGADDVGAMREILERRFKNDWRTPDLILLDGGKGQLNVAKRVLRENKLKIPMLAIAKGPTRKKLEIHSHGDIPRIPKKIISQVRDEAHRFAINYHKKLRENEFLK